MSTFTEQKNIITSRIKENNNQEITGQIMQDTLISMLEYSEQSRVQVSNLTGPAVLVPDKRLVLDLVSNITFKIGNPPTDGYEHFYGIDILTGDTTYEVTFPDTIKWVKSLELVPNARHMIIIDQNRVAMWAAVTK
jgi:hypothetical protein